MSGDRGFDAKCSKGKNKMTKNSRKRVDSHKTIRTSNIDAVNGKSICDVLGRDSVIMQFAFLKKDHELRVREWHPGMGKFVKGAEAVGYAVMAFFDGEEVVLTSNRLHHTPQAALDAWDFTNKPDEIMWYADIDTAHDALAGSIGMEVL